MGLINASLEIHLCHSLTGYHLNYAFINGFHRPYTRYGCNYITRDVYFDGEFLPFAIMHSNEWRMTTWPISIFILLSNLLVSITLVKWDKNFIYLIYLMYGWKYSYYALSFLKYYIAFLNVPMHVWWIGIFIFSKSRACRTCSLLVSKRYNNFQHFLLFFVPNVKQLLPLAKIMCQVLARKLVIRSYMKFAKTKITWCNKSFSICIVIIFWILSHDPREKVEGLDSQFQSAHAVWVINKLCCK
jgi:hypothetical protein